MATESTTSTARDFVDLHDKLSRDIHELHQWLKEAEEYGQPQFGQLGDRVRVIRDAIARHFAREEEGGYMTAPLEAAPHLSERADALLAEHPRLLTEFDRLCTALCACPVTYTRWSDAHRDVQQAIEHLHAHEHRENELWQEAFDADMSTLD